MAVAAKPYARVSETAQGDWLEHMYADPPDWHPEGISELARGLSFLSQDVTGFDPDARVAFLPHPQEALQQSQSGELACQSFVSLAVDLGVVNWKYVMFTHNE